VKDEAGLKDNMSRSQIVRNEGMKDTVVVSENRAWTKGLWLRNQSEAWGGGSPSLI
jgi:hypothetical protein